MLDNTITMETWRNRLNLMDTIVEMKASKDLRLTTEAALRTLTHREGKEKIAADLVTILKTTKTEEEAIQAIKEKYNLK